MRTHSNDFKNAIKEYGRQFNDTIYYNNTTYNGDHIFSVNYSVDSSLFKSVMQTLKIDTDISMNVGDTLDYGISVAGASDEIRFNNFVVNKIEYQKDKKSKLITCYDNMIKTMVDYESLNVTYPIMIRNYLTALCNHLGLTFKNASDTFTNYNKTITSEHYVDSDGNKMGYTFRDVLDDIAEATGNFIVINKKGELEVKKITNATGKNLYQFNTSGTYYFNYFDSSHTTTISNNNMRTLYLKCDPNTTYTISKLRSSRNWVGSSSTTPTFNVQIHNITNMSENTTYDGKTRVSATITTGADDEYIAMNVCDNTIDGNYFTQIRNSVQVEVGNEATAFERYEIDIINEDYFNDKNVNINKKVGPYNVLILSRANDSDNIHRPTTLPQNPIELKITNNPILEQDNREDFIDGIYNNINGLEFYLNDFTTTGILYYEIGDKYRVSIDNTTYPCLMLSDDIKRTTGLKEIIHTNEPTISVTDYKYSSTTDKVGIATKNAKILVDKANASIEQIVEAVGENGEVTSASIVQSINDSGSQIKLNADKIYINGVTFDNDQNMTITEGTIYIQQSAGDNSIYTYEDDSITNTRTETSMFPAGTYSCIRDMSNDTITEYAEYYSIANKIKDNSTGDYYEATSHELGLYDSNNNKKFYVDGATGETIVGSIRTKNMLDKTGIILNNGLNSDTGQPYSASNRNYFEYTKVNSNTTYTLSGCTPVIICFYNSSKSYLSYATGFTFTTPSNCQYVRIVINNTYTYTNIQLEEGSTQTAYTPYQSIDKSFTYNEVDMINSLVNSFKLVYKSTTGNNFQFSFTDRDASKKCYLVILSKGATDGNFSGIWFIRAGGTTSAKICNTGNTANMTSSISGNTITCTFSAMANYCFVNVYQVMITS